MKRTDRNKNGLRNLMLLLGGMALLEGNRRWAATFHASSLEPAGVIGEGSAISNGRRVIVQSVLDATPETVWEWVRRSATFSEVVHPFISYTARDSRPWPTIWQVGDTVSINLLCFGLIPLGAHEITISRIDEDKHVAETRERGTLTPVWNHTIRVQPFGERQTLYTDQGDLDAGLLNPLIGPFILFLFRYRQTRLKSLVARTT